jgi:hypothetical protein
MLHPAPGQHQPPLSWPVHQQAARKHDVSATGTANPRTQSQTNRQQKDETKGVPARDDGTED